MSNILLNPFFVLKVSPRSSREEIFQAAEHVALVAESDGCAESRSILVNPRRRLDAEVSWFPGLSPKRVIALLDVLDADPGSVMSQANLSGLAYVNFLSAYLAKGVHSDSPEIFAAVLDALTSELDSLDREGVLEDINADRTVAGFPALSDVSLLDEVIDSHVRNISDVVGAAFDDLATEKMIEIVTRYAETWTDAGEDLLSDFAESVLNRYETQSHAFLESESEAISGLIERAAKIAASNPSLLQKNIVEIETATRNWDSVAQPIQLLAKAKGITHEVSRNLGFKIRSLSIELHNEHSLTDLAERVSRLVSEVFDELPELAEKAEEDLRALGEIKESRASEENERRQRLAELAYEAEIGLVFKEKLVLSGAHIAYGATRFSLDQITRVRWGGVRNSVNGIPTGTDYTIAFGDATREAVVSLRRGKVYEEFTSRLWKAVGVELLFKIIAELRNGRVFSFSGPMSIADEYVELTKGGSFFSSAETKRYRWADVTVSSYGGDFEITSTNEKKFSGSMSYIYTANAHVFEVLIRAAFKKPGCGRLSDAYKN
jgi:hypothetical protein